MAFEGNGVQMRRPEKLELGGRYTLRNGQEISIGQTFNDIVIHKPGENSSNDHLNGQCTFWVKNLNASPGYQWYIGDGPMRGWRYVVGRTIKKPDDPWDIIWNEPFEMEQLDLFS